MTTAKFIDDLIGVLQKEPKVYNPKAYNPEVERASSKRPTVPWDAWRSYLPPTNDESLLAGINQAFYQIRETMLASMMGGIHINENELRWTARWLKTKMGHDLEKKVAELYSPVLAELPDEASRKSFLFTFCESIFHMSQYLAGKGRYEIHLYQSDWSYFLEHPAEFSFHQQSRVMQQGLALHQDYHLVKIVNKGKEEVWQGGTWCYGSLLHLKKQGWPESTLPTVKKKSIEKLILPATEAGELMEGHLLPENPYLAEMVYIIRQEPEKYGLGDKNIDLLCQGVYLTYAALAAEIRSWKRIVT